MNERRTITLAGGLLVCAGIWGCGSGETPQQRPAVQAAAVVEADADRLMVTAVNYPLTYFAARIGGVHVELGSPSTGGEDPAEWSPDAGTVAQTQASDLILLNGAGYAKWIDRVSLPAAKLVDTSKRYTDRLLPLEEAVTHSHGPAGEHEHVGYAFTTWLDPELASGQAAAIAAAFTQARPEAAEDFRENLEDLQSDLQSLDSRLAATAELLAEEPLVFSHPVYQYLIARYGLRARSVHWEPNQAPSEHAWLELQKLVANHPASWMIWESDPDPATVDRLQLMGLGSVVFNPTSVNPATGDYLTSMQANAEALEKIAASVE